jgi:hypothetical protein
VGNNQALAPSLKRKPLLANDRVIAFFLAAAQILLFSPATYAGSNQPTAVVRGTVTDEDLKPLSGVQLKLIDEEQAVVCAAATGARGQFVLAHKVCGTCSLEVIPRKGAALASARIDDISGLQSRRIVVQLRHGFEVHGRVVHDQKGLKGLTVAVMPIGGQSKMHTLVHGSGWAETNKNGEFEMILTAGVKHLLITNERYPELPKTFERKLSIAGDSVIPDIELANNHHSPVASEQEEKQQ